jgi:hypothetical protein
MATLSEILDQQLRGVDMFQLVFDRQKVAERMAAAVQEHARTLIAPSDCCCVGMGVCDLHTLVESLGPG